MMPITTSNPKPEPEICRISGRVLGPGNLFKISFFNKMFFQREREIERERERQKQRKFYQLQGINMIFNMVYFRILKRKRVFCKGIYSFLNV